MKTTYTYMLLIAGLFSLCFFINSCAKPGTSADKPKEEQVIGKWKINRVQLKIFSDDVFVKDSIIKSAPKPENFVNFGAGGNFEYKFNNSGSDVGTYSFAGSSVVVSNSAPKSYSWTMLTLTESLFTVVSKGTDPAFPNCYVERYQTFIR
jgi:hypothetical protein